MTVNAFWDWSLSHYAQDSIQQHLLNLQRVGDLVILEALFACWLATCGVRLSSKASEGMSDATRSWLNEVVLPLRGTREQWRCNPKLQSQRAHLLQLEVQAERHLAELMWASVALELDLQEHSLRTEGLEEVGVTMTENLMKLSVFRNGEYAPERSQLVALLLQAT